MLKKWFGTIGVLSLLICFSTVSLRAEEKAADSKKKAVEKKKVAKKKKVISDELFVMPDGNADELFAFIAKVKKIRTFVTRAEAAELRKEGPDALKKAVAMKRAATAKKAAAIKKAAEKVMELDKDPKSLNHLKAKGILLSTRIRTIFRAKTEEKLVLYNEVVEYLTAKGENIDSADSSIASTTCYGIRMTKDNALVVKAYGTLGKLLAKSKNKAIAERAKTFEGAVRLYSLEGNKIVLKGKMLADGKDFDITSLKGKVVLIDFWASWCGPCRREFPNMKVLYKAYKSRGFEIVGINLDRTKEKVDTYLKKDALPWMQLYEDKVAFKHPMAVHYGIMAIPQMILVDKDGTVISISARGKKLEELLAKKLGPKERKEEDVSVEN